ncbi:MAG: hypothetical protein LUD81_00740 [Clostridiales bacterium]|nr:hypothetical protein [Clostridiales bacterium]
MNEFSLTAGKGIGGFLTQKPEKNSFLTSRLVNFLVMAAIFTTFFMSFGVFAATGAEALTTAKNLLSKAAVAGGGLWAVWGLVQLGMSIKDHNGPGIQGAIWQLIGGAIIIAAGSAISSLDLTMA